MILASQSPRRIELMHEAGFDVTVAPANVDEAPLPHEDPAGLVSRLAAAKARAVAAESAQPRETVIAADTVVVLDDTVLGKPKDEDDAWRMLRALSGRTHQVMTGVHFCRTDAPGRPARNMSFVSITDVTFYDLDDAEIEAYVASDEPLDKAGAYGIQGEGGRLLVQGIDGDFYNVVGLPIAEVVRNLELFEGLCAQLEQAEDMADAQEEEAVLGQDEANEIDADGLDAEDELPDETESELEKTAIAPALDEEALEEAAESGKPSDPGATQSVDAGDLDPTIAR